MADQPEVHIGENSPEQVAYKLMQHIADIELVSLSRADPRKPGRRGATRSWILNTYADCILTVRNAHRPNDRDLDAAKWLER